MKNKLNYIGIFILLIIFLIFYLTSDFFLSKKNINKEMPKTEEVEEVLTNEEEISIISDLYTNIRILYDVVNNKFTVDQDDILVIDNITYKKITNFDTVMNNLFTSNGINTYINTLKKYFVFDGNNYYLIGNLVTYQTYYFRGDNTNIYIINSTDNEINAIIYEKWTSNNKNTLATIKIIKVEDKWLVDNINILYSDNINN